MSPAFVADASIAVAWFHPAQATSEAEAWLDTLGRGSALVVPVLWPLEVANALLVLERRGRLIRAEREQALHSLAGLEFEIDPDSPRLAFDSLAALAAEHQLSVYDAAYLELARRRLLPLACKDGMLQAAARRCGVRLTP